MTALVEVRDLRVTYPGGVAAIRGVDLQVAAGDRVAVTGESGSGKSTLARALAGLVQPPAATGEVRFAGTHLLGAPAETLRRLRWAAVAYAPQGSPFNPVATIGAQLAEPLRTHAGLPVVAARRRVGSLAGELGLPAAMLDRYPHELSGGQLRRAMLTMALVLSPRLLVLDEPTAGLDPVSRQEVVAHIRHLAEERDFALVVVSHDLPDAVALADRTVVLYAGEVVESGASRAVVGDPRHPYSWALIGSVPVMSTTRDLRPVRGRPPDARALPAGCAFHPRCTQAEPVCRNEHPGLRPAHGRQVACHFGGLRDLLVGTDLHKTFGQGRYVVPAVRGASVLLREGESVGLVGPSGSGKSTLARMLAGHLRPDAGTVVLQGVPLSGSWQRGARLGRRRIQLVQQDPWDALSPRMAVSELVAEPLWIAGSGGAAASRVVQALESVGLPGTGAFLAARVHELSGGQLQRVALARALLADPKVLIADEPTAMLDASEAARLLVLLRERQAELGLGLLFVSHDMATVRKVTDRVLVLDGGRVVEEGPSHLVSGRPASLVARRLVSAAPGFDLTGSTADSVRPADDDLASEGSRP